MARLKKSRKSKKQSVKISTTIIFIAGTIIIFAGIFIFTTQTSNSKVALKNLNCIYPQFSFDGKKLYFISTKVLHEPGTLAYYEFSTKKVKIYSLKEKIQEFAFSKNGILAYKDKNGSLKIQQKNNIIEITKKVKNFKWSFDGKHIAFQTDKGLHLYTLKKQKSCQLIQEETNFKIRGFSWSHNSKNIISCKLNLKSYESDLLKTNLKTLSSEVLAHSVSIDKDPVYSWKDDEIYVVRSKIPKPTPKHINLQKLKAHIAKFNFKKKTFAEHVEDKGIINSIVSVKDGLLINAMAYSKNSP